MKKGQGVMGLPFVFIIAIIIAAIVVIFAIRTIGNLNCNQEQIKINMFVSDLKKDIEKAFYASAGSQMIFTGQLPVGGCAKIEKVCIATDPPREENPSLDYTFWDSYLRSNYDDVNHNQLYFYPKDNLHKASIAQNYNIQPKGIKIALRINNYPECFDVKASKNGKIEIFLINKVDTDGELKIFIEEFSIP